MNSLYKPSKWLILVLLGLCIPGAGAGAADLNLEDKTYIAAEGLVADMLPAPSLAAGTGPVVLSGGGPGMPPGMPPGPPPGMPPGPPGGGMMLPLMDVDLSDDQVEKLVQLKDSLMDKVGPKMAKIHALERDLRNALCQPQINASDVAHISSQISAEKQTLDGLFTENAISTAQILTAEQRQKIKAVMNRRELGPPGFHPHFIERTQIHQ
jgi:Spy/CpxP family protein refolding chaperone